MQTETTTTTAKRATRKPRATSTVEQNDFSLSQFTDGVRDLFADFDRSPLTFIKENPIRAAFGAFFIGLIFGSALSKRAVTK